MTALSDKMRALQARLANYDWKERPFALAAVDRVKEELPALVIALKECADNLATEVEAVYDGARHDPVMEKIFQRDMAPVNNARAILKRIEERLQ